MIPVQPLPYAYDALEPALSRDQMRFHYERHYLRYVERANEMTRGRFHSAGDAVNWARRRGDQRLFEQAAQAWSHQVYFDSMVPCAAGPSAAALRLLGPGFTDRWVVAAESVFGSGWVWLMATGPDDGALLLMPQIVATRDAEIPQGLVVVVMDVWEHAYWYDYPGLRAEYAKAWVEKLADWARLERLYAR